MAALAVLVQHMLPLAHAGRFYRAIGWFDFGQFGVVLFFLLSGYVIPPAVARHGLRRFWIGRAFRLLPLVWVAIAGVILVSWAGLIRPGVPWFVDAVHYDRIGKAIVANALLLHPLFGEPHLLGLFWTLTLEVWFYATVSAAFALGLRRPLPMAVALLAASALIDHLAPRLFGIGATTPALLFLAVMWSGSAYRAERVPWVLPLALLILLAAPTVWGWYSWGTSCGRVAAVTVFCAARARSWAPPRWLVRVGGISYSLYLLHVFVLVAIPPTPWSPLTLTIWTAAALLVAAVGYVVIERPAQWLVAKTDQVSPAPIQIQAPA